MQSYVYGADKRVFVPSQNGHYAAELTQNGCTYLTQCYEVVIRVGSEDQKDESKILIIPNPAHEMVELRSQSPIQSYQLLSQQGQKFLDEQLQWVRSVKIKLKGLTKWSVRTYSI